MAVRIPIEADAQAVLSAFDQIRRAMRETGQEGVAFKDLDFSHPELRELEGDIRRVTEQMDALSKVGRGTTATDLRSIRKRVGDDPLAWIDDVEKTFSAEGERARAGHVARVGRQVLNGTRFEPPPPPPSEPAAAPDEEAEPDQDPAPEEPENRPQPRKRKGGGGFLNTLKRGGEFAIGATIGEDLLSGVIHAYEGAKQEDVQNDSLFRHLDDTGTSFDQLRDKVRGLADSLEITDNEAQGLASSWARLTNTTSSTQATADVSYVGNFARGYGADPGEMVQAFGREKYLGEDPRRFAVLLADAVREGNRDGSVEETARAMVRWTEVATRNLVDHDNLPQFTALYAAMNASGKPGLMGQNAEQIIGQIDSSITGGGNAGPAGQALMMRALMRYGIRDPYDAAYQLSGGAFEEIKGRDGKSTGITNLQAVMEEIRRSFPRASNHEMDSVLHSLFGISLRQADAFLQPNATGADPGALDRAARRAGVDLTQVTDPGALREMELAVGPKGDLAGVEAGLRARKDLDPTDVARLDAADKSKDPQQLQDAILQTLATRGRTMTDADTIRKADADLSNELERTASTLVVPLSGLRDNVAKLIDPVRAIASYLASMFTRFDDTVTTKDAANLAGGIEDYPAFLRDQQAAEHGDQAAAERAKSYQDRAAEGGHRFFHPWDQPGGSDRRRELSPDIANFAVTQAQAAHTDPAADLALLRVEGGGYDKESPAGAWGPGQLKPGTAADMGVHDIHDWKDNIGGEHRYRLYLWNKYHGDADTAIAAYNWGEGNVDSSGFAQSHNMALLPPETQGEVKLYHQYHDLYEKRLKDQHGDPNPRLIPQPPAAPAPMNSKWLTPPPGDAGVAPESIAQAIARAAAQQAAAPAAGAAAPTDARVQHEVHVAPVEVNIRHPDGSLQRKLAPVTHVPPPQAAGSFAEQKTHLEHLEAIAHGGMRALATDRRTPSIPASHYADPGAS